MAALNRFTLARYVETPEDIAVPVVDDVPLYELLGDRYPGLPVGLVVPPARQWLGGPTYVQDGRVVILGGTCGSAGCCGVMARIALTRDSVIWRDFFARGAPDLPKGLRFEFDRTEYENALATLPTAPRLEWSDDERDEES